MAGGQRGGAEIAGGVEQVAELHPLIAAHARDGRRPGEGGVDEIVHYVGAESVLVIENVMRNAEPICDPARIVDVLAGGTADRKSVVAGKSVSGREDPGGRRFMKREN